MVAVSSTDGFTSVAAAIALLLYCYCVWEECVCGAPAWLTCAGVYSIFYDNGLLKQCQMSLPSSFSQTFDVVNLAATPY